MDDISKGPITTLYDVVSMQAGMTDAHDVGQDVHFFRVQVNPALDGEELFAEKQTFVGALQRALAHGEGAWCKMTASELAQGPSYITLGGWLGDQGAALRLIGLGAVYGLFTVVIPEAMGIEGPEADELAGGGMVMPLLTAEGRVVLGLDPIPVPDGPQMKED